MSEHNVSEMQRAINDLGIEISAMSCGVEDISETEKFPGDTLQKQYRQNYCRL